MVIVVRYSQWRRENCGIVKEVKELVSCSANEALCDDIHPRSAWHQPRNGELWIVNMFGRRTVRKDMMTHTVPDVPR